jgi:hypothetical protein
MEAIDEETDHRTFSASRLETLRSRAADFRGLCKEVPWKENDVKNWRYITTKELYKKSARVRLTRVVLIF